MFPRNLRPLGNLIALMFAACFVEGRALAQGRSDVAAPAVEPDRSNAVNNRPLGEFLIGTKWLMYEIPGRIVEFGPNGKFLLDDWRIHDIEGRWKVTGPKQVTVTVISQKFRNLTAVFNFDDRLSYFTGHDLDRNRQVTKSPRINMVPNDPADPYRWR
jgi:hypothetical protein